ncbi:DUF6033 family protein [Anaerovibrio sp.]|uniref:DUF6033 family protein n=1 Tax=Anaerovibrio sp. TaxID=1872532 RepID=UPI00388FF8E7
MPVRIGQSYVSEAAAEYAKARQKEREEAAANEKGSVFSELQGKFSGMKFSIGTNPFSGMGTNNVSISPKILMQMENDPEKRLEYEALLYDVSNTDLVQGRNLKSAGWIIDDNGGLRAWSVGVSDNRNQSFVKRSNTKNWWQELLDKQSKKAKKTSKGSLKALQEKIEEKKKEMASELKDIPYLPVDQRALKRMADSHVTDILRDNTEKIMQIPYNGNPMLAKAYLQNNKVAGTSQAFKNIDELNAYLWDNYQVVSGGMTSISSKYLQKCLTDDDSRNRLFDILRAADESYASRKDEVGFQGMNVRISENGEVTTESSKSTVTVNEGKRSRQIAAAATQKDMQAVIALLEQDLQEVEDGYKQNKCDEAEVEKVKRLLAEAKQRMGTLPDREPTQEEQSIMSINMLI